VTRFRKSTEAAQQESSTLGSELAVKRQLLQQAQQELEAIDRHSCRQLAVLRWQNAAALVGCRCQESTVQSGGHTGVLQGLLST
jgi:outer membrane PBP1 activator LpoA protein